MNSSGCPPVTPHRVDIHNLQGSYTVGRTQADVVGYEVFNFPCLDTIAIKGHYHVFSDKALGTR